MNRKLVVGFVALLLTVMALCSAAGLATVYYMRSSSTVAEATAAPAQVTTVAYQNAATTAPTLEKASVATVTGAKGSDGTQVADVATASQDFSALFEQVEPGVVAIQTYVQQAGQTGEGAGSGFIIDDSGLIVTNEHVIEDATRIEVVFYDGTAATATVLGSNLDSDLAVLQVESMPENVHVLKLGDSDTVVPGQSVVAIGNPYGLQNTITYGIVSAVGRIIPSRTGNYTIPQAIQTDAAINPGNSGGPLINMAGEVIGVNAQIYSGGTSSSNAGIGFAIPVNIVKMVEPTLAQGESYVWPWIGVSGTDMDMVLAEAGNLSVQRGAYVDSVTAGGPADKAGLQGSTGTTQYGGMTVPVGGDVITAANGQPVQSFTDLLEMLAFSKVGDNMTLTVLRGGQEVQLTVTLAARPSQSQ